MLEIQFVRRTNTVIVVVAMGSDGEPADSVIVAGRADILVQVIRIQVPCHQSSPRRRARQDDGRAQNPERYFQNTIWFPYFHNDLPLLNLLLEILPNGVKYYFKAPDRP